MYELYGNYIPGEDIVTARAKAQVSPDAIIFLSAMTQIVIDIADAFNANFSSFNLTAIAPSYPYIMYRAGMQILMSADLADDTTEHNFNSVRKCCWHFGHRWLIAGKFPLTIRSLTSHSLTLFAATYLETLESAAVQLGLSLPSFGSFVRPNGVTPGLC